MKSNRANDEPSACHPKGNEEKLDDAIPKFVGRDERLVFIFKHGGCRDVSVKRLRRETFPSPKCRTSIIVRIWFL